ncbi:NADH-ubiquinone oxidoreductase-F iron-sulfur binding region domain-containing protein, partial [Conexibacter stalactiti]
ARRGRGRGRGAWRERGARRGGDRPMSAADLPRLLAGAPGPGPTTLGEHLALHGLPALAPDPGALLDAVEQAGLRGRGGASFPTAHKLRTLAAARGRLRRRPLAIVANGAEGEPASGKDRALLTRSPHLVLDGLQLLALALGARELHVAVRANAPSHQAREQRRVSHRSGTKLSAAQVIDAALTERAVAGRDHVPVTVTELPAGFVAGEERAVVSALNGGAAVPSLARPWERGVGGAPTLVQNVETLAHVALIARHGAAWFRALGSDTEPGSTLVTIGGAVARPGVREVALGTPLAALLDAAGAGLADEQRRVLVAERPKVAGALAQAAGAPRAAALLVGGYAGGWISSAAAAGTRLLEADLRPLGATVGCGVIAVLPRGACGVAETVRLTRWLADESAGQCGPCVHGLDAIASALEPLREPGRPVDDPLPGVRRWCGDVSGRGACRHPDGAVRMLRSALRLFAAEFDDHARNGACAACAATPTLPLPAPGPTVVMA